MKPTLKKIHLEYIENFFNECKDDFDMPQCIVDVLGKLKASKGFDAMDDQALFDDELVRIFRYGLVLGFTQLKKDEVPLFTHQALSVLVEKSEEICFEEEFQNDFLNTFRTDEVKS